LQLRLGVDLATVIVTSPRRIRGIHPFLRDIGSTALAGGLAMAGNIILVSLVGRAMGTSSLAQYLLVRRIVGWMQSTLIVCSAMALPYYVSRETSEREGREYFLAAIVTDGLLVAAAGLILLSARNVSSFLLFGDSRLRQLILPLAVWNMGYVFHIATFGYYRGRLVMKTANVLQIVNIAALLFLAFAIFAHSRNIVAMLTWTGILMMIFSAVYAFPKRASIRTRPAEIIDKARRLLTYGFPRVPSQFGFISLTAMGPIIASHYLPLADVTYLLLAVTVFNAFSLIVVPLNVVLLSKVSRMLSQNRGVEVSKRLEVMQTGIFHLTAFAVLISLVFADVGLRVWLGKEFVKGALTMRILLIGVPFYVYISSIGSSIDAASVKAYNARNICFALVCFLLMVATAIHAAPREYLSQAIACALSVTLSILAFLTARSARFLLQVRVLWRAALPGLCLAAGLGLVGFLFRLSRQFQATPLECLVVTAILFAIYIWLLHANDTEWLRECCQMLVRQDS
jgi:O-antigen/teichoic acid export membrane protein